MVKKGNYVNFKLKARKNERTFHWESNGCGAYRKITVEKRTLKKYIRHYSDFSQEFQDDVKKIWFHKSLSQSIKKLFRNQ